MSAGIRATLLVFPLMVFAFWGSLHTPGPDSAFDDDLALSSLPPLPAWTNNNLPDFSRYRDTTERKAAFFSFLYPRVALANSRILIEREYLEFLSSKETLNQSERTWLMNQADRLRVEEEPASPAMFKQLHARLDVIPPALVLAQAANESAWGTSRFATRGNNLFGQWCFSKGCGLVPKARVEGATHEVARFSSPYRSIRAYIQNLNSHPAYQGLRDVRMAARKDGKLASGSALAAGLISYSERGEDYVKEIRSMIRHNNLGYFDTDFQATFSGANTGMLQQMASASNETALLPNAGDDEDDSGDIH